MSQNPVGSDDGSTTSTPRWAKAFGIIVIVVVLLFVVLQVTGIGGRHGPGRHIPTGGAGGYTLPSSAIEDHTPSEKYLSSIARPMPVSLAVYDTGVQQL